MSLVQVRLARDSLQTPWGFRLQGGKDLSQELVVQRVFANTPSEGELQRGDVIVAINGRDTSNLSHKQAQDAISGGGGQIELLVQRPLGPVSIKPLTPKVDTRAPTFPTSPVRAPQIVIPVHKPGRSGPTSPVRIVPISPHKPASKPASYSDTGSTHAAADHMDSAGFMPRKVTMNKFGGGTTNFGTSFGSAPGGPQSPQRATPSQGYRPVAAPAHAHTQQTQINYQTQFTAPQHSPQSSNTTEDRGVEEETLGGVNERRRTFIQKDQRSNSALGSDEEDYPTAPVWERRQLFGKKAPSRSMRSAVPRSKKSLPTFEASYTTFGVDYSKPLPQKQPSKHSSAPRARPPPVNARIDETDSGSGWTGTLRGESKQLKPWEREALEMERYQGGTVDQPYRPHTQPPVAPKPKIVQISAQSTVRASGQPSSGGQGQSPGGAQVKPAVPGDRDWNNSYVYQMIHSSEKTTSSSASGHPGQPMTGETVTTTRRAEETRYPGQEPKRHVMETVQRQPINNYNAIAMSDF